MTIKKEFDQWKEEFLNLNSDSEREALKEKIHQSLSHKNENELIDGLLALKESARDLRIKTEEKVNKNKTLIQVFPVSENDIKILEALLLRMNIPFKISL